VRVVQMVLLRPELRVLRGGRLTHPDAGPPAVRLELPK
jgi:hypothetical protein